MPNRFLFGMSCAQALSDFLVGFTTRTGRILTAGRAVNFFLVFPNETFARDDRLAECISLGVVVWLLFQGLVYLVALVAPDILVPLLYTSYEENHPTIH